MRVAIELTALELDRGGTARAIVQTLERLRIDPRVELVEFAPSGEPRPGQIGTVLRGLWRELHYLPRELPRRVSASGADLLHCPSSLVPLHIDIPLVVTLHDVIGWDHPEWLTRANVLQLRHVLPRALRRGATVITSSRYSRDRIVEVLNVRPERIHVVPLGIDERFTPNSAMDDQKRRAGLGIDRPYLVTVGTLQPRKNLATAIEAFERLSCSEDLQLVIVGARGWRDDALFERIRRSSKAASILMVGHVSDDELVAVYRGAECFVFPSRYEGFGFPPLEAMASGVPVLSTTNTSLAEAVGDAGIEIHPDDPVGIAEQLQRVLESAELAAELRERGLAHAAQFNWARTVDLMIAAYESALVG